MVDLPEDSSNEKAQITILPFMGDAEAEVDYAHELALTQPVNLFTIGSMESIVWIS